MYNFINAGTGRIIAVASRVSRVVLYWCSIRDERSICRFSSSHKNVGVLVELRSRGWFAQRIAVVTVGRGLDEFKIFIVSPL